VADDVTRRAARLATVITVPVVLVAGLLAVLLLRAGDGPPETGPVEMSARPLGPRQATACRALLTQLPHALRDLAQRPVTAGGEQNAAYGDPAITLACGTALPSFPPTDTVLGLDGVCWYAAEGPDQTTWTTVDREVPVTVAVPTAYEQPGQWVIEFSTPVAAAIPAAARIPFGCRPG
jgi:Protein of unknown function (DUF3515)